jgi:hypothetical protein
MKKKPISPYTRLDRKYKETITRLIGMMIQRHQMPKADADYILEPLGEKAAAAYTGMVFYDEEGNRAS